MNHALSLRKMSYPYSGSCNSIVNIKLLNKCRNIIINPIIQEGSGKGVSTYKQGYSVEHPKLPNFAKPCVQQLSFEHPVIIISSRVKLF